MTILSDTNDRALKAVGAWIKIKYPSAKLLTSDDLEPFGLYSSGWEISSSIVEVSNLWLLFDGEFPYSMPRVIIRGNEESMLWPHVEKGGRLCLAGDGASVSTSEPVSVVENVLREAQRLIKENSVGLNTEDFQEDFQAYWRRETPSSEQKQIRFTLRSEGPSRIISAWHGDNFYFIAEDSHSVFRWMENRYGDDTRTTNNAVLIWLNQLPHPAQYPKSSADLRELVKSTSKDGLGIFDKVISAEPSSIVVILMGRSPEGKTVSFGVLVRKPQRTAQGRKKVIHAYAKGFRPGKVPAKIICSHYNFQKAVTVDVDSGRTRINKTVSAGLEIKKVTILGCGSLGSSVANLLVKSGIKRLHLVDSDLLGWDNLCRHELGASYVGEKKSSGLANKIKISNPQVLECTYSKLNWIQTYIRDEKLFNDSDLVISTTGDWNSEALLNDIGLAGEISCPILYGWMEAQAGASHGLLLEPKKGCLRCGFDKTGTALIPATLWTSDPAPHGCGGGTSIYGAIELSQAAAMIAQLAVDALLGRTSNRVWRTWLATTSDIISNGGMWNPQWKKRYGDPGDGGCLTANPWPDEDICVCKYL